MNRLAIGVDLGCTHIKVVLMDAQGHVLQQAHEETNEPDDKHWKELIRHLVHGFRTDTTEEVCVGLAAPGLANEANTCISFMPGRLPGLENFNWSEFVGHRVFVLNDAHAALMAEAGFGAARDVKHAIMLTLGTGVGGGILINGSLYQGMHQMAGHFGHTTIDSNSSERDVTNMPGSIENAIGNLTIRERSNGRFQTTWEVVEAHRQGDPFATWLWLTSVRQLSISLASFVNVLSPEVIILGGGISKAGDTLLKPLESFRANYEWRPGGKIIPIRLAAFSDQAGALGAAAFALAQTKSTN